MRTVIFDLETDNLLADVSVIWCISLRIIEDSIEGPTFSYSYNPKTGEDDIDDAVGIIEDADIVVGHNVLGYDLKVLDKLYPDFNPKPGQKVRDTQVLAQMYFANEKDKDFDRWRRGTLDGDNIGRQGLEAWGQRLGHFKGDYAKEMKALGLDPWKDFDHVRGVPYCEDDIEVTSRLWRKIESTEWAEEAILLEHQISELMSLQEEFGFHFNVAECEKIVAGLREEHDKLSAEAISHFGKWWAPDKKYLGEPREHFGEDDSRKMWAEVTVEKRETRKATPKEGPQAGITTQFSQDAPYCKLQYKEFNPGSRPQIIDRLKTIYEWEPVDFTEKGNPEVNDDVLRGLVEHWPICEVLAEVFFYKKILGMMSDGKQGWLAVQKNGFIHGRCNPGGTRSGRASHSSPNLAQVPKVVVTDVVDKETGEVRASLLVRGQVPKEFYKEDGTLKKSVILKGRAGDFGWECRNLFGAPNINGQQWWLMGCDLKGVELRCFGHHLAEYDGGAYAEIVINGDVHTVNQNAAGLNSRDNAKTFIYACVSMDTTALTRTGWKHYDDLIIGEEVLTYNIHKDVQEWKPILEKVKYENADTVTMRNRKGQGYYDVVVTPNHRWPVNRKTTVDGVPTVVREFRQTHELKSAMSIIGNAPLDDDVSTWDEIPLKSDFGVKEILTMSSSEREAFLTGFMIADGHMRGDQWNWSQNSGDHGEAALLCSYLAHEGMVGLHRHNHGKNEQMKGSLSKSRTWGCQKLEVFESEKQDVWCLKTENESFVMRRGDFITQTGNTLYGAGDEKIGSIVCLPNTAIGIMKARGRELKQKFQEGLPAYRSLMKRITKEARRGYLIGLDGRKLWVKSAHSALNLQLQSDGAILAKKWVCLFYQYMEDAGYVMGWNGDFTVGLWIHDEIQCPCRTKEIAEHAAILCKQAAIDAGNHFNYRVPIEADSKIGLTWAQTH